MLSWLWGMQVITNPTGLFVGSTDTIPGWKLMVTSVHSAMLVIVCNLTYVELWFWCLSIPFKSSKSHLVSTVRENTHEAEWCGSWWTRLNMTHQCFPTDWKDRLRNELKGLGIIMHTYNPSYLEVGDQEDLDLRPSQAKCYGVPILINKPRIMVHAHGPRYRGT
jgi:hypothetical protein